MALTGPAAAAVKRIPNEGTARTVIGVTPTEIHAKFAAVIRANISSKAGAARLAKLSTLEAQDLLYAYARNTGGNTTDVVAILRVYAPTQVARFQPLATRALNAYSGVDHAAQLRLQVRVGIPTPPSTGLDSTVQEIYLDFRTAPGGSLGATSAAYETSVYVVGNLAAAYGIGYTIGSGVNWLLQTYTPDLYNDIGGTIDVALEHLFDAGSSLLSGAEELGMANMFGISLGSINWANGFNQFDKSFGDWGIVDDVEYDISQCPNPLDC